MSPLVYPLARLLASGADFRFTGPHKDSSRQHRGHLGWRSEPIGVQVRCSWAARQKAEQVVAKLKEMKLADAVELLRAGIEETLY